MNLINEQLVEINSLLNCKEAVIKKVASLMLSEKRINNLEGFIQDIYDRENQVSTSMGLGIAIPHTRSYYVQKPTLVFIKLKNEIQWNDDHVKLIFGIAVPNDQQCDIHLKILSRLARKLMNLEFRNLLFQIHDVKEACGVLDFINHEEKAG
ncbi:MAG: PTS sugar transporter subunit IIA [Thomasclavelia sp.]